MTTGQPVDDRVRVLDQAQLCDGRLDSRQPITRRDVRRKTQLRGIPQRLACSELAMDEVLLRDHTDVVPQHPEMSMNIQPLIGHGPRRGASSAGEDAEQR